MAHLAVTSPQINSVKCYICTHQISEEEENFVRYHECKHAIHLTCAPLTTPLKCAECVLSFKKLDSKVASTGAKPVSAPSAAPSIWTGSKYVHTSDSAALFVARKPLVKGAKLEADARSYVVFNKPRVSELIKRGIRWEDLRRAGMTEEEFYELNYKKEDMETLLRP